MDPSLCSAVSAGIARGWIKLAPPCKPVSKSQETARKRRRRFIESGLTFKGQPRKRAARHPELRGMMGRALRVRQYELYGRDYYLRKKAELRAAGLTTEGKPWKNIRHADLRGLSKKKYNRLWQRWSRARKREMRMDRRTLENKPNKRK